MNYLEQKQILDRVVECFITRDLVNFMQTCKYFRNLIGMSKYWEYFDDNYYTSGYSTNYSEHLDRINIMNIIKIYTNLKINKFNTAVRDYYGPYYYLFVLRYILTSLGNADWDLYTLINNFKEFETMYQLCSIVGLF